MDLDMNIITKRMDIWYTLRNLKVIVTLTMFKRVVQLNKYSGIRSDGEIMTGHKMEDLII
jgi:hypothetical protein